MFPDFFALFLAEEEAKEPEKEAMSASDLLKIHRGSLNKAARPCVGLHKAVDAKMENGQQLQITAASAKQENGGAKKRKLADVDFFSRTPSKSDVDTLPPSALQHKLPSLAKGLSANKDIEFVEEEDALSYSKYTGEDTGQDSALLVGAVVNPGFKAQVKVAGEPELKKTKLSPRKQRAKVRVR